MSKWRKFFFFFAVLFDDIFLQLSRPLQNFDKRKNILNLDFSLWPFALIMQPHLHNAD